MNLVPVLSRAQWLAAVVGLIGVFMVSVGIGGLIARQLQSPAVPAVAVASPTPMATVVPTVSSTASPTLVSLPSLPATVSPPITPTASTEPTPSPEPTATLDPPTVEEFTADLAAALRDGDTAYLIARLHPATTDRYGEQRCTSYVQGLPKAAPKWEVLSSTGPAPWSYVTETPGIETVIPDAWTVSVRQPGANPELRDLHFAPSDGTWRWFTDCGTPQ